MDNFRKSEQPIYESKPPQVVDVLTSIISRARVKPKMFPTDYRGAANYWLAHQEPASEHTERVEQVMTNDKIFWKTPYHDRVTGSLKTFLGLTPIDQMFVIENIERGIPWRSDSIDMYKMIIREGEIMKADKAAYIENALQRMKEFRFAN